jgi:hypothetical protein
MIQHRRHLKVYGIQYRYTVYTNLYGIPYTRTYTEFRRISRYCTEKKFAELREIKSILYKIPYSAEFQEGNSENNLASWTWSCVADKVMQIDMDIDMQHGHRQPKQTWTWTCSMVVDMDMQHGHWHGHAASTWKKSMDMDMKQGHGHNAWTWSWCTDMDTQHGTGQEAWTWTCSMDPGYTVWTCAYTMCSMDLDMFT